MTGSATGHSDTTTTETHIRVGTRASALALAQTEMIAEAITRASGTAVDLVPITSDGDRSTESLASIGGTGVFASALRDGLLADQCDLLVHSLKDLPTAAHPGLIVGAIPHRQDARDTLCARDSLTLATLPDGARVGTGSPRRVAQLKAARPDLDVVDIRGNVGTRLGRVRAGDLDAVVLAAAGLSRLGLLEVVTEFFPLQEWPTAPGQGALGVEAREGPGGASSPALTDILAALNHAPSQLAAVAERCVLAQLEAGCAAPVGATAIVDGGMLLLTATVYRTDGTEQLTSSHAVILEGTAAERLAQSQELGAIVGHQLLADGAAELVDAARNSRPDTP